MTKKWKVKYLPEMERNYLRLLLIILGILQMIVIIERIVSERYQFWKYSTELGKYYLVKGTAVALSDMLEGFGPSLLHGFIIVVSIIPCYLFLRYYIGAKSIYTMLRLPQKRVWFYISNMQEIVRLIFLAWVVQFGLLFLYYGLYRLVIPFESQPHELWNSLWNSYWVQFYYPMSNWLEWIRPICFILYAPSLMLLLAILLKCERARLFGVGAVLLSLAAVVTSFINLSLSVFLLPIATVIVIGCGIYYVIKRSII